jgi:hypothetical protein
VALISAAVEGVVPEISMNWGVIDSGRRRCSLCRTCSSYSSWLYARASSTRALLAAPS